MDAASKSAIVPHRPLFDWAQDEAAYNALMRRYARAENTRDKAEHELRRAKRGEITKRRRDFQISVHALLMIEAEIAKLKRK